MRSAPAKTPIQPSPVQSMKIVPRTRVRRPVSVSRAITAAMLSPPFSTESTRWFGISVRRGSASTIRRYAPLSVFGSARALIRLASSQSPLSRKSVFLFGCDPAAPSVPTPSSMLELPPITGRSWTSAVRAPVRAAASAAPMPAVPAPTTTTSYVPPSATASVSPANFRLAAASASPPSGGT